MVIGGARLAFDQPALRVSLVLDPPGAMLLAVVALVWIAAGAYAFADVRGKPNAEFFAVCWLLTLIGSLGVFIAADLLTFYLVYALVSIPAFGLIAHDGGAEARRAGGVYMAFTVLGEAFLLMGFVLLASAEPSGSLRIADVMAALPGSPWRDAALALTIAGFGLKIALVPMHGWMPLAYTAAPIPAAAVLSGAAVKAGVIGLIRFLPFELALPGWGEAPVVLGFFSAFYGVAIGITQQNPKTVLAYSSISQMGAIAAVVGMGLVSADKGVALDAAFYAAHHALVKGALFLAIGVAAASSARRLWRVLAPAAVLALSLGGLPLTGGALAKLAIKAPLGAGIVGSLATVSAAGTTLLMLHFLRRLAGTASRSGGGGACRACPAMAGDGAGFRPRSLAALSRRWWPTQRCAHPRSIIGSALAGFDRRRTSPRLVALGEPPAARTRRRYYRSVGSRLPRELRLRRQIGANGCPASPVARGGPVASGDRGRSRHGHVCRALSGPIDLSPIRRSRRRPGPNARPVRHRFAASWDRGWRSGR